MYKYTKRDLTLMVLDALGEEEPQRSRIKKPIDKAEMKGDLLFFLSIMSLGIIVVSSIFYGGLWIWQYSIKDVILHLFK